MGIRSDNGNGKVLIVDDEPNAVKVLSAILSDDGYEVYESNDVERALKIIHRNDVDTVITDLKMPGRDGMELFENLTANHRDIPVIFLTAYGTVESAVSAMTRGAFYYFIKPPDYLKLKSILARAVEQRCLRRDLEALKKRLFHDHSCYRIIGSSPEMQKIIESIEALKDSASSILLSGETGTGKELLARTLHSRSKRKEMPFVAVNCAAIPKELIESELFGYEKGAFTGALSRRIGRFEEAVDGIIFLDEIGELEISLQAKLLRVLQEKEIERIGSNRKIKIDFRLISSTNRALKKQVQAGNFREDLFYRLNVIEITVPPLRERAADIPLLAADFINEFCIREKKTLTISDAVMRIFQRYHWPGNIRQLRNVVERATVLARGSSITTKELPEEFLALRKHKAPHSSLKTLKDIEIQAVEEALRTYDGNKSKASRALGISRKAFYKRLREANPSRRV